ncbi:MAG TPA: hypothetical protein PLZ55_03010, partial [bacterium]|nr:hypothetical protein [bacterium]
TPTPIPTVTPTPTPPSPGWNFNESGNFEGWVPANITGAAVQDGVLKGRATNTDPIIRLNFQPNLARGSLTAVTVRIKVDAATQCQIFVGANGFKRLGNYSLTPGEFQEITAQFSSEVLAAGELTFLRVDPAIAQGVNCEIDWVKLE